MPLDERDEGLVLRSFDYKDRQKIMTLFTLKRGVISLIVKGITRKKTHLLTLTSPFTHGEYLFRIHRSNLYTFQDGTPLNTNYALRQTLPHIEAATILVQALYTSQFPEKPAPSLYQLTLTYLKHLPAFDNPKAISASFLLKLLKHDGHLALTPTCSHCNTPPTHLHLGEAYCSHHTPVPATYFTPTEWPLLTILLETRSISTLQQLQISTELHEKIEKLLLHPLMY